MGTSVSQSSPRGSNWNRVHACFKYPNSSEQRIINEVWRAADNQEFPISHFIESEEVYYCYDLIKNQNDFRTALSDYNSYILKEKNNTFICELIKRLIPKSYTTENPSETFKSNVFAEITNYIISRDSSGFVGSNFRNQTVNELINYKSQIKDLVIDQVNNLKTEPNTFIEWKNYVKKVLESLKKYKK